MDLHLIEVHSIQFSDLNCLLFSGFLVKPLAFLESLIWDHQECFGTIITFKLFFPLFIFTVNWLYVL